MSTEPADIYTYVSEELTSKDENVLPLSLNRVLFLNAASLGLYTFYWFYRNWKDLDVWPLDHKPGLKTLGLFVPILNLFIMYRFFKTILESVSDSVSQRVGPIALTLLTQVAFASGRVLHKQPQISENTSTLIQILILTLVLYIFQPVIFAYWQEQGEPSERKHFLLGEKILLCIGAFLWFFSLLAA